MKRMNQRLFLWIGWEVIDLKNGSNLDHFQQISAAAAAADDDDDDEDESIIRRS